MPYVTVNGTPYEAQAGALLSSVFFPGHGPDMPCAGHGRCGKCRVVVRGALSPLSDTERLHLSAQEIVDGVRLVCCTHLEGNCTVELEQPYASQIRLAESLPTCAAAPMFSSYGVAVDIGTTTLAACLYGSAGNLLAQAGAPNPQAAWGADVLSRVQAARQGNGHALAVAVRSAICTLLETLTEQSHISTKMVDALVITGNTAMLYLLTETDPEELSHAPFAASRLFDEMLSADTLGLPLPDARVYLPRCISAFLGADLTTALLASGICAQSDTRMLADIGTNGEVALWHQGQLWCCSTAAGPAFEGTGLSMGMAGKTGAIDHVCIRKGALHAHVIGNASPKGICGSGVIDALACLLELEQLDETGVLENKTALIASPVRLTQQDIRMVQLAKSALCAGMDTLLHECNVSADDVVELAVAGGFGSYLNVASATRIGLLPPVLEPCVRVTGNAALDGAAMLLLDQNYISETNAFAMRAQTIDLSTNTFFMSAYMDGMFFQ